MVVVYDSGGGIWIRIRSGGGRAAVVDGRGDGSGGSIWIWIGGGIWTQIGCGIWIRIRSGGGR